ncbi:hypothetical protein KBB12_02150 [Candidatus Woesebacteria bacterium]|nr:hypothetical protein [Candidatus Woesebacteria bacterium]
MSNVPRTIKSQGQILLIGLMLIALVTTIVGTGALRSMSSTQTTKQKEESNKASNIAKGALEAGINNEIVDSTNFTDVNPGAYSQQLNIPKTPENTFVYSEVVPKDHQYMFYLADYDTAANTFGTDYYVSGIELYYSSEASTCPLLEIIFIDKDNAVVNRKYTAPTASGCGTNSLNYVGAISPNPGGDLAWDGKTTTFANKITIDSIDLTGKNIKVLVIRPYFDGTKLGFLGTSLKQQGREVSSTVRTIDGAQKTEKVYQAYPQIPLSLFATVL